MGHPRAKLWGQHPVHSGAAAGTDPPTSPCQGPSTTTVNRLALLTAPHKQAKLDWTQEPLHLLEA